MNQENVKKIQSRVIELLTSQGEATLNILAFDCCSEMARLAGGWIQEMYKPDKLFILKGIDLKNGDHPHDVLAISKDTNISVVDPTIWQFFPDRGIFVGEYRTLKETASELNKIYGGRWELSEELKNITEMQTKEWETLINETLAENLTKLKKKG